MTIALILAAGKLQSVENIVHAGTRQIEENSHPHVREPVLASFARAQKSTSAGP
jgi:hypothetical protein